jgi:hypothetical protein
MVANHFVKVRETLRRSTPDILVICILGFVMPSVDRYFGYGFLTSLILFIAMTLICSVASRVLREWWRNKPIPGE